MIIVFACWPRNGVWILKTINEIRENKKIKVIQSGEDDGYALAEHNHPKGKPITVVFSWGAGWGHVSASYPNRCLTWEEMCFIKDWFFNEEECVVQYRPKKSEYVNRHPYCLHLWKQQGVEYTTPPMILVG